MNYAIDSGGAQDTGSKIAGKEPDATAKVNQILQGYLDCQSHSTAATDLSGAFEDFHNRYKTGHTNFPKSVTKLGQNTVLGANIMVDSEDVSAGVHQRIATTGQQLVIDVDTPAKDVNK